MSAITPEVEAEIQRLNKERERVIKEICSLEKILEDLEKNLLRYKLIPMRQFINKRIKP